MTDTTQTPERVEPDVYTDDYYLTNCHGYEDFVTSGGRKVGPRFIKALSLAGALQGKRVLDVGCGRGELVIQSAMRGADAWGIDYAQAAVDIADRALTSVADAALAALMHVRQADVKALPFEDGFFDVVFMMDVVEHLYPHELAAAFDELSRTMKPGGMLIMHTSPNKIFEAVVYPNWSRRINQAALAISRRLKINDGLFNETMLPTDREFPHDAFERDAHQRAVSPAFTRRRRAPRVCRPQHAVLGATVEGWVLRVAAPQRGTGRARLPALRSAAEQLSAAEPPLLQPYLDDRGAPLMGELSGRNALVLGVERPDGRRAAIALAEAGANVAVVTLAEDTPAEFAANSTANEFWAIGIKGIALTSDSRETTVAEAIADATTELGPISILVYHAHAPLDASALSRLRSDPAVVVLIGSNASPDDARALLNWTRDLAGAGLRANALLASRAIADAIGPTIKEHHAAQPLDLAHAAVYLASDASAAIEGAALVAE